MIGSELPSSKFFQRLFELDEDELRKQQKAGCPRCGGRLDRADYARKPRGLPSQLGLEPLFSVRFSLCCCREGCRRRLTPVSVRFLGRRVYVGVVVLLAAAVTLVAALLAYGVPRRTVQRWKHWWTRMFPVSDFWLIARARFVPPLEDGELPGALIERFFGDPASALQAALAFVAPITSGSARSSFSMGP